jgi:uncharacterized protein YneF (UPF0154 family)
MTWMVFVMLVATVVIGLVVYGLFLGGKAFMKAINPTPLPNEEIVKQTKYCEENGMQAGFMMSQLNGSISRIQCMSK